LVLGILAFWSFGEPPQAVKKIMQEAKIINDCYSFIKWILPIIGRYPRNYRYTLGERIELSLYELLSHLQRAYIVQVKVDYLTEASFLLDHIRLLLRLSHEMYLFDSKIHHAMIQQMGNLGKQLGGWLKSAGGAE
jgi:hypothetical protein